MATSDLGVLVDLGYPIVMCEAVTRRYAVRGDEVVALDGVDLEVETGQLVALAGPSGSGKSTLLAILGCIDRPTSGRVRVVEQEVTGLGRKERRYVRRRMVATVLPQPADNVLLRRTGLDNVRIAARHRLASVDPAKLRDVIDAVGIGDFAERTCATMSGGEQQRVALACALVGGTPLVLADEPTGALDAVSAATVIDALVRIAATGTTIVAATHDPHVIAAASTVIRLDHGRRVG